MNIKTIESEQVDHNFIWRLFFTLCCLAIITEASDVFASASVTDAFGDTFCKVLKVLRGNTMRALAIIGMIVLGVQTLRGKLQWEVALVTVAAIIIIFKAPEIVQLITGDTGACGSTS